MVLIFFVQIYTCAVLHQKNQCFLVGCVWPQTLKQRRDCLRSGEHFSDCNGGSSLDTHKPSHNCAYTVLGILKGNRRWQQPLAAPTVSATVVGCFAFRYIHLQYFISFYSVPTYILHSFSVFHSWLSNAVLSSFHSRHSLQRVPACQSH